MNGLIRFSLGNPFAVTVIALTIIVLGSLSILMIPVDILPVFKSAAVQVLTFYGGMPASGIEKDITNRMERWVGQANGTRRQESRSIVGASIVRDYFHSDVDPSGALTQVNSLALATIPNLPPGTLPPVVLPFDPTSTVPVCIVALNGRFESESILYDVGRYEVRNMIMGINGAIAPVVYGGKIRAVIAYLDSHKLQARGLSPLDAMNALDSYNVFLPTGDAKLGDTDYAIDSNSMYELVEDMGSIPLRAKSGNAAYLRDVATPRDASLIQTNVVRVNGRRQVYIPVFRQLGASTLTVVQTLKNALGDMKSRLTRPGINLELVMDQSIYVRQSINSIIEAGLLGAVLCSLVILVFLGQWRMTLIAVLTIPVSALAAIICLYYSGNTINVMTLAGLALAVGPLVDIAIICLENTQRHLGLGALPHEAAFVGAKEVAMPALVASLCTLLVLAPLALMPGMGEFLYRPMALAVAFAMISAYLLSQSLVPAACAHWLRPLARHGADEERRRVSWFDRWEGVLESAIGWYARKLEAVLRYRRTTVAVALLALATAIGFFGIHLRREFFPEVDAGAFEMYVRAPSGTRIEITEKKVAQVENFIRGQLRQNVKLIISELGVNSDWSAAYTPNAAPMDAVIKVQLAENRSRSAQEYVHQLRIGLASERRFADLDFAFDAGGMIRGAMNEGRSTPLNIRITGKAQEVARAIAEKIQRAIVGVPGVVDARIIQRLDYPEYVINVDRAKAADLGLSQNDVMRNVVAAFNSSIQFNKKNFWIDSKGGNQYFVGVQYPEGSIESIDSLLNIPITGPSQRRPVPLSNLVSLQRTTVPTEVTHTNIQPTIDLAAGIYGRDLGHVADDVSVILDGFGERLSDGSWVPYDPSSQTNAKLVGSRIILSGEYARMQETFQNLSMGLLLATLLIYFLMVALFRSYLTPLVILFAVPIGLVGVIAILFITGTAINIQSLLGVIFMVGIVVSNAVLLVDFAQNLRTLQGLSADQAIRRAALIRVRPVVMTALAAFFALVPMALALSRGSEANGPLGRAVIGGLLAGLVTTLFVVPALYSLVVHDPPTAEASPQPPPETDVDPIADFNWV